MSLIKKALYIKKNVDEKRSCAMLERCTRQLPFPVSFMVTTNCFFALECAEHTYFDLIIGENDFNDFNFQDMKKILRTVGNRTPLILLEPRDYPTPEIHGEFYDVLEEPFSASELCNLIERIMDSPTVNVVPVNRAAQVSAVSVSATDNTTNTASSVLTTSADAGFFGRFSAGASTHLEAIDEELPTTFDTQITFGLEGAYAVLPPTAEEAAKADEDEIQTVNALSGLARTKAATSSLPSDTLHNIFHNDSASAAVTAPANGVTADGRNTSKLDAIRGVFAAASAASYAAGSHNNGRAAIATGTASGMCQTSQTSRINGLLERMGSDLLHCYPPTTALAAPPHCVNDGGHQSGRGLPDRHEIRQLYSDFDCEGNKKQIAVQNFKKRALENGSV